MSSQLSKRVAVAAVGIPAAFALVFAGGWPLAALLAVLGVAGTRELFTMARLAGARPNLGLGAILAVAAPALVLAIVNDWIAPGWALMAGAGFVFLPLVAAVFTYREGEPAILSVAVMVFAPVYASVLPSALLWLRHGVPGVSPLAATWLVFFPLAMTWICDTFAMGGGSMLGGPKFAPTVSPNKTWSGTISGLAGALLVAWVFSWAVFERFGFAIPLGAALLAGVAVGVFGQIGDLAESAFKRSVGVKDSGTFFPGHGGVLDRMDSLYWSLPLVGFVLFAFGVL